MDVSAQTYTADNAPVDAGLLLGVERKVELEHICVAFGFCFYTHRQIQGDQGARLVSTHVSLQSISSGYGCLSMQEGR